MVVLTRTLTHRVLTKWTVNGVNETPLLLLLLLFWVGWLIDRLVDWLVGGLVGWWVS